MTTKLERGVHDRSGWLRGCRCRRCHAALLEHARTRRAVRAVRDGRPLRMNVAAARARRHLEVLRAAGWSVRAVARSSGVSERVLWSILTGPAARRIEVRTELAVLAVSGAPA